MVSTLGFKKFTKKPANGLTIASYWGCWRTGGVRRVPRLTEACGRRSARLGHFVLRYGVQQS